MKHHYADVMIFGNKYRFVGGKIDYFGKVHVDEIMAI